MTRIATALLIAAVLITGSAAAAAHDQFRFVGTVVRLEAAKNLLTFKTREDKKDLTLKVHLTAKTTIQRDGKPVPRSDLKPGVAIVVSGAPNTRSCGRRQSP